MGLGHMEFCKSSIIEVLVIRSGIWWALRSSSMAFTIMEHSNSARNLGEGGWLGHDHVDVGFGENILVVAKVCNRSGVIALRMIPKYDANLDP
jgi:hypothetical protein